MENPFKFGGIVRENRVVAPELIDQLPMIVAQQDSPHYELLWRSVSQLQKKLLMALSTDHDSKPFQRIFNSPTVSVLHLP